MRHFHRNIVFGTPSPRRIADLEAGYEQLLVRIDRIDELMLDAENLPTSEQMRQAAERYYASFRPAIDTFGKDSKAFEVASDDGLWLLAELEDEALRIERFGERQAASALTEVEAAADSAQTLLILKSLGHILIGAGLAYLIMRNLSEQRRAAGELAQALQIKTDFIADISHELRTPLTVLRANAEIAADLEGPCVHTDLLKEIVYESERMSRLVEDLLFLARSDAGALPLQWEIVNIRAFLAELAERANLVAREYDTAVDADLVAEGIVQIDRARVAQAVLNLVDNAAKYGSPGKTITLASRLQNAELVVAVVDHGPGIAEQDLVRVFERFYRVDKARSRGSGGAGLGLAITRSIINSHGGRIEAESSPNSGTTMRFYLPLASVPQPTQLIAERLVTREVA
jgi:signal transduction histidine kinase